MAQPVTILIIALTCLPLCAEDDVSDAEKLEKEDEEEGNWTP